jgi:hypothetical protein
MSGEPGDYRKTSIEIKTKEEPTLVATFHGETEGGWLGRREDGRSNRLYPLNIWLFVQRRFLDIG